MTLKHAIKIKNKKEVNSITKSLTFADVADILEKISPKRAVSYFKMLNFSHRSEIFNSIDFDYKIKLIKLFSDRELKVYINELFTDEIADIIEDIEDVKLQSRILKVLNKETRKDVDKILSYDDDVVGSIMSIDIIMIQQGWTVDQATKFIKNNKNNADFTHYFFVVNNKNKLVGYILTEDLLFESSSKKIKSFIKPAVSVTTRTDKEQAALVFANYDMSVLPVINSKKELVGAITSDDVIDVMQEAASEDMHKMAGIDMEGDQLYSKLGIFKIFKSRVFWLMLLMISATLSQIVLDAFQDIAKSALAGATITSAIIAILPVISGSAGNAGSQSSTTVIRSLALGDITPRQYFKVFWKEFRVSLLIGLALGVANILRLFLYYWAKGELTGDNSLQYYVLSLAASLAVFVVIILAKITGGLLPLAAKALRLDPAVMAAPLLTTLIDALSTLLFFGISIGIMVLVI